MTNKTASVLPASVALAADHAGFALKEVLKTALAAKGVAVLDLGTADAETRVDYPDYAAILARALQEGRAPLGIAICGTGIGISIALNRYKWVRAALCHSAETAEMARAHNDANVLCLGGRVLEEATARACLDAFLNTPFAGGRHAARVNKLGGLC